MESLPIKELFELLKPWGPMGAVVLLLGWRIWHLEREKAESIRERLGDWKEVGAIVKEQSVVMADWVTANEARTRAIEAQADAQKVQTTAVTAQTEALHRLAEIVERARDSNQKVREALIAKGLDL